MIAELIVKWFVPFLCGGAVSALGVLAAYIRNQHKREKAVETGVQCLLRAEIIRSHDKYTERGFCPLYAKEALTLAYKSYHALGGNDVATRLFTEMMQLPPQ